MATHKQERKHPQHEEAAKEAAKQPSHTELLHSSRKQRNAALEAQGLPAPELPPDPKDAAAKQADAASRSAGPSGAGDDPAAATGRTVAAVAAEGVQADAQARDLDLDPKAQEGKPTASLIHGKVGGDKVHAVLPGQPDPVPPGMQGQNGPPVTPNFATGAQGASEPDFGRPPANAKPSTGNGGGSSHKRK
jgi:hypothetical protein